MTLSTAQGQVLEPEAAAQTNTSARQLVESVLTLRTTSGPAAAPGGVPASQPKAIDPEGIARLQATTGGKVQISINKATGAVRFVRLPAGSLLMKSGATVSREEQAAAFFNEYGSIFGLRDARAELRALGARQDAAGGSHLSYEQVYQGVPVFAGVLRAHFNAANELTAINGTVIPNLALATTPRLTAERAAELAIAEVLARPATQQSKPVHLAAEDLKLGRNQLAIYRTGLVQGIAGTNHLVYALEVTDERAVREFVYIDANSGKLVDRISGVNEDLHRELYDPLPLRRNLVWREGRPLPTGNEDWDSILYTSEDTYNLYASMTNGGYLSFSGTDRTMITVNDDPRINCPNANWNGVTTNYCTGVTGDDTVAHEWTHAYTEYTHGLIYAWQPGALNESYSDIFGEVVDILNNYGPNDGTINVMRTSGTCSNSNHYVRVVHVNAPSEIAGHYRANRAAFGPDIPATGLTGDLVMAEDEGPVATDACSSLSNAAAVAGKIVLATRPAATSEGLLCSYVEQAQNAQAAGATALIIINYNSRWESLFFPDGEDASITIPTLLVGNITGQVLRSGLTSGANATLKHEDQLDPSVRWASGEDDPSFGDPIRDMWDPTCYGHPGKVSDRQYLCTTFDGGGVHRNSGVPNHGFALLVDGGVYNGQTIRGIGVTKATHIYWQAMSVYQTPTTDFSDHADALEASCQDLVGTNLFALDVNSPRGTRSGERLTASDCGELSKMIAAVEFRTEPVQCEFEPLLDPDAPALCEGASGNPTPVFTEDFDSLSAWTLMNQGVFSGWTDTDWQLDSNLPGGRTGSAAVAPDPDAGNCDGGSGDISGAMYMTSPAITIIPGATTVRLAFDHYIATELGWDGGNVKISVNGGDFNLIPESAFLFNPYNTEMPTEEDGNTNPLAGQPGFSGTNGGTVLGSWGQSQIDLATLGIHGGDVVRLRYDFGRDGCGGMDGWYVDDVQVYTCASGLTADKSASVSPGAPGRSPDFMRLSMQLSGMLVLSAGAVTLRHRRPDQDD
jgi:Zn-dependent metalloprotease